MRTRLHSTVVLVFLVFLSSCTNKLEEPFRLGINSWPGYAPLYVAKHNALFDRKGIDIIELPSTTETIHALAMGNLEAAALTLDEVLTVIGLGVDVQIVMVLDMSNGADALVAKPYVASLNELVGKTLAVERSAVGAFMLGQALASVKIPTSEINVINCTYNDHVRCFSSVDAIVTFEPTVSHLVANGGKVMFDSAKIPNTVIAVVAIKRAVINKQPDTISNLIDGYYRARVFMVEHPELTRKYLSKFLGIDVDRIDAAFEKIYLPSRSEVEGLMTGSPSSLTLSARRIEKVMKKNHLLSNYQEPEHLVTNEFITQ